MATHSNILAWKVLWTEEPGGLQSMGSQKESDTTEVTEHACVLALPDHWEESLNLYEPLFSHL